MAAKTRSASPCAEGKAEISALDGLAAEELSELLGKTKKWRGAYDVQPTATAAGKGNFEFLDRAFNSPKWKKAFSAEKHLFAADGEYVFRQACRGDKAVLKAFLAAENVALDEKIEFAASVSDVVLGDEGLSKTFAELFGQVDWEEPGKVDLGGWGLSSLLEGLDLVSEKKKLELFVDGFADQRRRGREICVFAKTDRLAGKLRSLKEALVEPLRAFDSLPALAEHFESGEFLRKASQASNAATKGDDELFRAMARGTLSNQLYAQNPDLAAVRELFEIGIACEKGGKFAWSFETTVHEAKKGKASKEDVAKVEALVEALGLRAASVPNPARASKAAAEEAYRSIDEMAEMARAHLGLEAKEIGGGRLSLFFKDESYSTHGMNALAGYLPRAAVVSVYRPSSVDPGLVARSVFHEYTHFLQDACFDLTKVKDYDEKAAEFYGRTTAPSDPEMGAAWKRISKALSLRADRGQIVDFVIGAASRWAEFDLGGFKEELARDCEQAGGVKRGFEAFAGRHFEADERGRRRCVHGRGVRLSEEEFEALSKDVEVLASLEGKPDFYRRLWKARDERLEGGLVYLRNEAEIHSRLNESMTGISSLIEEKSGYLHPEHAKKVAKPLKAFNALVVDRFRKLQAAKRADPKPKVRLAP